MLNGIDPLIIFSFSKATKVAGASPIPVAESFLSKIPLPDVPIYLSETLTGIYIDIEEKDVGMNTDIDTNVLGKTPEVNQRSISNTVKITMVASSDSIGVTLLSAMTDKIFPLVTSKEYSITYVHGSTVILQGFLHSFSISQNSNDDLYHIVMEIINPGLPVKSDAADVPNKTATNVQLTDGLPVKQ